MAPRFSLHRRNGKYFAQLWSEDLGRYLTARCTGATSRTEASVVAARWLDQGWPTGRKGGRRPATDAAAMASFLSQVRTLPLTPDDAHRIVGVCRRRAVLGIATMLARKGRLVHRYQADSDSATSS